MLIYKEIMELAFGLKACHPLKSSEFNYGIINVLIYKEIEMVAS